MTSDTFDLLIQIAAHLTMISRGYATTKAEADALLDKIGAMLKADEEQQQLSDWQPMETAPKDGTGFLVYWPLSLTGGPEIDRLGGWAEYEEIVGFGEPPASHWMPLPAPPPDVLADARSTPVEDAGSSGSRHRS